MHAIFADPFLWAVLNPFAPGQWNVMRSTECMPLPLNQSPRISHAAE